MARIAMSTSRHTLEERTVAAILNTTRGFGLIRSRYIKAMQEMGYSRADALLSYEDVWDVAELRRMAAQ